MFLNPNQGQYEKRSQDPIPAISLHFPEQIIPGGFFFFIIPVKVAPGSLRLVRPHPARFLCFRALWMALFSSQFQIEDDVFNFRFPDFNIMHDFSM